MRPVSVDSIAGSGETHTCLYCHRLRRVGLRCGKWLDFNTWGPEGEQSKVVLFMSLVCSGDEQGKVSYISTPRWASPARRSTSSGVPHPMRGDWVQQYAHTLLIKIYYFNFTQSACWLTALSYRDAIRASLFFVVLHFSSIYFSLFNSRMLFIDLF